MQSQYRALHQSASRGNHNAALSYYRRAYHLPNILNIRHFVITLCELRWLLWQVDLLLLLNVI